MWSVLWVVLFNLFQPSGHQGDISASEYWSGKGLTSTILRDLVETKGGNQKDEGSSPTGGGVVGTVVPVVVVLLVLIVGAIAGVIFWRR